METKYTPATLVADKNQVLFSIPLYQRLFEWQDQEINQLLTDLWASSEKISDKPYYIGMLTTYKQKNSFDLVDGQQRFIVLMLMAIVFEWKEFLLVENDVRLSFFARKKDEQYLKSKIYGEAQVVYTNAKMEAGIKCIRDFAEKLEDGKRKKFSDYIYHNLTFFISDLPEKYQLHDLNRYFEAMNATGRGLENHEILKVDLLRKLNDNKEHYTKIWNVVSDMDKPLLRQRSVGESIFDFRKRQSTALLFLNNNDELFGFCNNSNKLTDSENVSDFKTIKAIGLISVAPTTQIRSVGERAILNFPEFLLQVLWIQLSEGERRESSDFFNVHKLQETFKKSLKSENVELFFDNLLKYRILFDYFIIRISNNDQNSTTYTLAYKEDSTESIDREKLIKYQSMLYVSTSSNIWLTNTLSYLETVATSIDTVALLKRLIDFDNKRRNTIKNLSLRYGDIDRYWFWRLDYYLWAEEMQMPVNEQNKAILGYVFRTNRSIEHLHPQSSSEPWDIDELNSFGNLAMISSGFNSTQSNDDEKVKFARIKTQIEGKFILESIKLLLMHQIAEEQNNGNWAKSLAKEHGNKMIQTLIDSFPEKGFDNIRSELENLKK